MNASTDNAMQLALDSKYKLEVAGFVRLNRPIILMISKFNVVN